MYKYIIALTIGGGLIAASYHIGHNNGVHSAALSSQKAVELELKRQGETDEKISKIGDTAKCGGLNGRLSDSGECE